jgi:hypothetical protein
MSQVDNIALTDEHRKSLSQNDDVVSLIQSESLESYLQKMLQPGEWGDCVMLACASRLYRRSIHVILDDNDGSLIKFHHPVKEKRNICEQELQPLTLGFIKSAGARAPNHYVHLRHRKIEVNPSTGSTPVTVSSRGTNKSVVVQNSFKDCHY